MKPLYLSIEGLYNKEKTEYDFTTQTANLVALYNQDIIELKNLLALGFFGGEKTGKLTLRYEYNGEKYSVKRNFEENKAEFSYKDGNIIYDEIDEVNNNIMAHLKMNKETFDKLVMIDRDSIFNGFMLPSEGREEFLSKITNSLMCDKAEVESIENKTKQKFDTVSLQIELIEEVDPNELERLKTEIKEKGIIRQDAKTEIEFLNKSILKGEQAKEALQSLEEEKLRLSNTLAMQSVIDEMELLIEKSNQAEMALLLVERKESIIEKNKEYKEKVLILQEEIEAHARSVAKGEKTSKDIEKVLIHCVERLSELRKILYNRIEALGGDESFQKSIRANIDNYYKDDESELDILNGRKGEVEEEIEAVRTSCSNLITRKAEIERKADIKKAIRDGAIFESEMNRLKDNIAANKLSLEYYDNKLTKIVPEIERLQKQTAEQKESLAITNNYIVGSFNGQDEAINNATVAQQEIYKNHIEISFLESELEAIEKKIAENTEALTSYQEDMVALEGAKSGLDAYIKQITEKKAELEQKLIKIRIEKGEIDKLVSLEFGQRCPICTNVVLHKDERQYNANNMLATEKKLVTDLNKSEDIIKEYNIKYEKINQRLGELTARIKISEAYIDSLKESIELKKKAISKALQLSGTNSPYELELRLGLVTEKNEEIRDAVNNYNELLRGVKFNEETLALLIGERTYLEQEQIPLIVYSHDKASEELRSLERAYVAFSESLGGIAAKDRLEELTLIEKESDTLEQELATKRTKLDELFLEMKALNDIIYSISSRRGTVKIGDKEYDNQDLIIKVIGSKIGEVLEEIKESEKEAEEIKVEYSAVRKVITRIENDMSIKQYELENLKAKIDSNEKMLEIIFADFDDKLAIFNLASTKAINELILTDERLQDLKDEIATHYTEIAIRRNNIERLEKMLAENHEDRISLDENKATTLILQEKQEDIGQKIASIVAKRAEMKSRAKQKIAFKDKLSKYTEKIKLLADISKLYDKDGKLDEFIIKLSSKRLYALTKGKYNLEIIDGMLELINNSKGGKVVGKDKYNVEEKLMVSLVLGTSLHRALIDMVGGEEFMIMFPLKEKEATSDIIVALATYAKKKSLIVVTENENVLEQLKKL